MVRAIRNKLKERRGNPEWIWEAVANWNAMIGVFRASLIYKGKFDKNLKKGNILPEEAAKGEGPKI